MRFLPCPLFCNSEMENNSNNYNPIPPESSSAFLSPQPSLPSVPSLASPSQHRHDQQAPLPVDHRCIATLKGHKSYVFSLILAGKHLYSGSYDNEIRVWSRDSNDSNFNNNVATGSGAVKSLAVSGDKLFSAHQDHRIRVWKINNDDDDSNNPRNYHCIATLPTMNNRFLTLFSAKNYVQVRRHKMCTWVHHVDTVSALALSDDGSLLYSASWDRTFKVWKTSNFRCLESVANAHDDAINALCLSKDGFVYTGSADKKIKVWKKQHTPAAAGAGEKKKHSLVATLEKHRSGVNALALSGDGSVLYSGACDRSIIVWERDYGTGGTSRHMVVVGALRGHSMAILCLATASDHLLCSGSADKTIRIWRRSGVDKSYSCLAVLEGHTKPVKCLQAAVDASGHDKSNSAATAGNSCLLLVYSGSLDCDIKVWKVWVPLL